MKSEPRQLTCSFPGCGFKAWTLGQMRNHIKKKHPGAKTR